MVGTVIKSLVSQGKRVIIPDFGAFLIKDCTLSNILTKENVTFSPFLKYNDGFLENELAHKHGLHKEDARLQVAAFVNAVKTSIFIDERAFEVTGFGFFYKDKQGNVTFSVNRPFEIEATRKIESNTDITYEDKSAIDEDVLVEDSTQEAACFISNSTIPLEKEIEADENIGEESVVDVIEKELVEIEVKSEKKSEKKTDSLPTKEIQLEVKQEKELKNPDNNSSNNTPSKRKPKKLLVSFIMIVVALFVLNLFWTDLFGTKSDASKPQIVLDPIDTEQKEVETEKVEAKEVAQDAIDNEVVATVEKAVKNASSNTYPVEKEVKKSTETRKNPVKEKEKDTNSKKVSNTESKKLSKESSANETKSYVVVLGSFETNENAEKHVANLAKKKVKGHVVHRSKVYSVVTSTFKTYDEAQKERDRVKVLGVDGWISSK